MPERLNRYWRVLATGFSFLVFGASGLLVRCLVLPLVQLAVRDPLRRVALARALVAWAFRSFIGMMRALGVLRYEIIGLEKLDRKGLLILANHPTLIDTVFLMAFVKNADCIVKSSLRRNAFTRGAVCAAGYVSNEHGAGLIDDCIASVRAGNNLIVFPEGTRTPANGEIVLKRGAANIAVRGACMVTPVVISCQPLTLGKGEHWWQVPASQARFRIEVKDDIDAAGIIGAGTSSVMAARHLTDYLQQFFTESQPNA